MLDQKQTAVVPLSDEKRRFQRVRVNLLGRYMLPNRREYPCQVIDMSPGGVRLVAPAIGEISDRVVVYLDHIGRIEGQIARQLDGGFAISINATARKRDKLAAQLTWLANRLELGLSEDRRHSRLVPRNPFTELALENGPAQPCEIVDLSLSGAAINCADMPVVGSRILLGQLSGFVVRRIETGGALEFDPVQTIETLSEQFGQID